MNTKAEEYLGSVLPAVSFLSFCIAEFLIFYSPDAREDWPRMLTCAIISPFMFTLAVYAMLWGLVAIYPVSVCFFHFIKFKDLQGLLESCVTFCVSSAIGGGIIAYWVYAIVVERCPAFGYNPFNTYAVVGVNTVLAIPILGILGLVSSLFLFCLLYVIGRVAGAILRLI